MAGWCTGMSNPLVCWGMVGYGYGVVWLSVVECGGGVEGMLTDGSEEKLQSQLHSTFSHRLEHDH